uniref:Uncharacterized protein n=1 Tax=Anguilla anguilla TaxID=7936 RepID=A0A0E9PKG3_ANGAN
MQLIGRMQNDHCSVLIYFHYCKQRWVPFPYFVFIVIVLFEPVATISFVFSDNYSVCN